MRLLDIRLIYHCVLQGRIDALMAQELLHLFDRHAFVDGHRCERPAEFVGVDPAQVQLFAKLVHPDLDPANLQPVVGMLQRNEQGGVVVRPAVQVVLEVYLRPGVEIHLPLFVPLAEHDALAVREVDILPVEEHQLADAHSGGRQQVDQSQIPTVFAVVAHDLQRLVGVGFLDRSARLYLVYAADGAFHDVVLILQPGKKARKDPPDIVDGGLSRGSVCLVLIQIEPQIIGRDLEHALADGIEHVAQGGFVVVDRLLRTPFDPFGRKKQLQVIDIGLRTGFL